MGHPDFDDVVLRWGPTATEWTTVPRAQVPLLCEASVSERVILAAPIGRAEAVAALVPGCSASDRAFVEYNDGKGLFSKVEATQARLVCITAPLYATRSGAVKGIAALYRQLEGFRRIVIVALPPGVFDHMSVKPAAASHGAGLSTAPFDIGLVKPPVPPPDGELESDYSSDIDAEFVGMSQAASDVKRRICEIASATGPVLIHGEPGTGQKLVARLIHRASGREAKWGDMVSVICEAIPAKRVEVAWCGCVAGAVRWAKSAQEGAFARAGGGTVFFDEIGSLSMGDQARLIEILTNEQFTPLGGVPAPLRARIIASTRHDLLATVGSGRFRRDLYDRFSAHRIETPPLRRMRSDIGGIARHLWGQVLYEHSRATGGTLPAREMFMAIGRDVERFLQRFSWSGNARQLHAYLTRVLGLALKDGRPPGIALFRRALGSEQNQDFAPPEDI